jgi:hypothetical protein
MAPLNRGARQFQATAQARKGRFKKKRRKNFFEFGPVAVKPAWTS